MCKPNAFFFALGYIFFSKREIETTANMFASITIYRYQGMNGNDNPKNPFRFDLCHL